MGARETAGSGGMSWVKRALMWLKEKRLLTDAEVEAIAKRLRRFKGFLEG